MASMKELVPEYRAAAVKLALWLKEKEASGTLTAQEERSVREALTGIREVQRLMDGYYELPRAPDYAAVGWKAGQSNDD